MHITAHHPLTNSHPAPLSGIVAWIGRAYARWQDGIAERQALATMDDRDLRDAGLTRWAVEREIARPFWRG